MRVFIGNDNIQDALVAVRQWRHAATSDAHRYRSGFYTDHELRVALHVSTGVAAAAVLGLDAHGSKPGDNATFVIVKALNAAAAVAAVPAERTIVRSGKFESGHAGHQHGVAINATA
ncbi:hypothetical protein [Caballeronia sp. INDeC2]|uniref:hypothetical protein n=1 Tax=Caballeronia sp. INDeC2 TaxID=2921747 RepID=UPI0020292B84|nr:hypothetical protein [Caballeronia sp. INDeC2]